MFDLQILKKEKIIGSGAFGDVYEVIMKSGESDKKYAAKISSSEINENCNETISSIKNELNIISKLNHPSIIKFIGYNIRNFENESKPTIIMELASNNSLRHMISLAREFRNPPQWNVTKKIINIFGIASGLAYLHSHNIIHRDLKPENILLDDYLYPKITDFGLSKICSDISQTANSNPKGTLHYMSPEMYMGEYSYATDVYSFGIIIYEILTEKVPFQGLNFPQISKKVLNEGFKPNFQEDFPESYKNLIIRCGSLIPGDRPTFNDIINQLQTDRQFILAGIDEREYLNYIEFIKECRATFLSTSIVIDFDDFIKNKNSSIQKVSLKTQNFQIHHFLYPFEQYMKLNEECKQLIQNAEKNPEYQFIIGKSCIENENGFPMNTEIGLRYLKRSIKEVGYIQSILYYSQILISGKIIPQNLQKAKKLLDRILDTKSAEAYALYGKIMVKEDNYKEAESYFLKGIERGSGKAMNNYGKMLLKGNGIENSKEKALYYFLMADRNQYQKAAKYLSIISKVEKTVLSFKIILLGASGVGKTSLLNALYDRPFQYERMTTVGCDVNRIEFLRDENTIVNLIVWDTSGQERFANAIPIQNYRDADAAFICYSKDDDETVDKWINRVKEYSPDCKIFLIETKADKLDESQKQVSRVHGKQLIQTYDCYMYLMTSSKTMEGVKCLLKYAANLSAANSPITTETVPLVEDQSEVKINKHNCQC
ncbi:hypothetical protein M9Y10_000616 [Tritrichomonas musculus]|uniref:Protein kinase domain-containing protein n=1 Tax=Tritrichomonas musculus TaxID=1915356 RepID=A0ABR2L543_9EUKA